MRRHSRASSRSSQASAVHQHQSPEVFAHQNFLRAIVSSHPISIATGLSGSQAVIQSMRGSDSPLRVYNPIPVPVSILIKPPVMPPNVLVPVSQIIGSQQAALRTVKSPQFVPPHMRQQDSTEPFDDFELATDWEITAPNSARKLDMLSKQLDQLALRVSEHGESFRGMPIGSSKKQLLPSRRHATETSKRGTFLTQGEQDAENSEEKVGPAPHTVEAAPFPGFSDDGSRPLPFEVQTPHILQKIMEDVPLKGTPLDILEMIFMCEENAVLVEDCFWWYYCEKFQKDEAAQDQMFSRMAMNYVTLFMHVESKYKNTLLLAYATSLAQAVAAAFNTCFYKSPAVKYDTSFFRAELLQTILYWTTGTRPARTEDWKPVRIATNYFQAQKEEKKAPRTTGSMKHIGPRRSSATVGGDTDRRQSHASVRGDRRESHSSSASGHHSEGSRLGVGDTALPSSRSLRSRQPGFESARSDARHATPRSGMPAKKVILPKLRDLSPGMIARKRKERREERAKQAQEAAAASATNPLLHAHPGRTPFAARHTTTTTSSAGDSRSASPAITAFTTPVAPMQTTVPPVPKGIRSALQPLPTPKGLLAKTALASGTATLPIPATATTTDATASAATDRRRLTLSLDLPPTLAAKLAKATEKVDRQIDATPVQRKKEKFKSCPLLPLPLATRTNFDIMSVCPFMKRFLEQRHVTLPQNHAVSLSHIPEWPESIREKAETYEQARMHAVDVQKSSAAQYKGVRRRVDHDLLVQRNRFVRDMHQMEDTQVKVMRSKKHMHRLSDRIASQRVAWMSDGDERDKILPASEESESQLHADILETHQVTIYDIGV
eukprot:TRINITY_DN8662_c0_g1_i1.p1 TRINITY_DN8662_c0_g1~~TRINITY_DN8662_c0_g1_i1.p1  ORF type:complete len:835 (+),score=148.81 TRINITY_DN8662_c0_g1_i1:75-2579(+)